MKKFTNVIGYAFIPSHIVGWESPQAPSGYAPISAKISKCVADNGDDIIGFMLPCLTTILAPIYTGISSGYTCGIGKIEYEVYYKKTS